MLGDGGRGLSMNENERTDRVPVMQTLAQVKKGEKLVRSPATDERADWIGGELRKLYDETANEPIPDRLLQLLKELEKDEGEGSPST